MHVERWTRWTTTRARQVGRRVLLRGTSGGHIRGPLSPAEVDQIRAIVRSELAAAAPAQSRDVWTRYKVYRPNGALTPVLEAIGELVARTARIEAKTDRLLGVPSRPPEQQAPAPQRRFRIPLPAAPPSLGAAGVEGAREIDAVVDVSMFVPRVLAERGFGGYEADALPHFLAALSQAPEGAFLDIGLNVGPYALLARAHSARHVVGFEPTPELAAAARSIADASGLGYAVEQVALGAEDGTATLYLSDSTDSSNSLSGSFRPNSYTLEVPLERLDSWTARTGLEPGLLKIDTETTEPAVVAGGLGTLERARPWIFCEVLPGGPAEELETLLAPLGLHRYHLSGRGELQEQPHLFGHPREYMWLLTPTPLTQRHWALAEEWRTSLGACGVGREVPLAEAG